MSARGDAAPEPAPVGVAALAAGVSPSTGGETVAGPARLDWFTTGLGPDGDQLVHIRPTAARDPAGVVPLGPGASRLLLAVLNELALADPEVPWAAARQAVLRSFYADARTSQPRRS